MKFSGIKTEKNRLTSLGLTLETKTMLASASVSGINAIQGNEESFSPEVETLANPDIAFREREAGRATTTETEGLAAAQSDDIPASRPATKSNDSSDELTDAPTASSAQREPTLGVGVIDEKGIERVKVDYVIYKLKGQGDESYPKVGEEDARKEVEQLGWHIWRNSFGQMKIDSADAQFYQLELAKTEEQIQEEAIEKTGPKFSGWTDEQYQGFVADRAISIIREEMDKASAAAGLDVDNRYQIQRYNRNNDLLRSLRWAGSAPLGGTKQDVNSSSQATKLHEFGHSLGFDHAVFLEPTEDQRFGKHTKVTYGSPFDVMGRSSEADLPNQHFSVTSKIDAGWIPQDAIQTYKSGEADGTSEEIELTPFDYFDPDNTRPSEDQTYRLDLKSGNRNLTVSYRHLYDGIVIEENGQLWDMTPSTASAADALLKPGQSVRLPGSDVTLTYVSMDPETKQARILLENPAGPEEAGDALAVA